MITSLTWVSHKSFIGFLAFCPSSRMSHSPANNPKNPLRASASESLPNTHLRDLLIHPWLKWMRLSCRGEIWWFIIRSELAITLNCFSRTFPRRTDLLLPSGAVMHISADRRPPVRPPCPLFPCSTPSELSAFTQSHALSWDELQQHGGQAALVQCTIFLHYNRFYFNKPVSSFLPVTVQQGLTSPHEMWPLSWSCRNAIPLKAPNCGISACRDMQLLSSPAPSLFQDTRVHERLSEFLNKNESEDIRNWWRGSVKLKVSHFKIKCMILCLVMNMSSSRGIVGKKRHTAS